MATERYDVIILGAGAMGCAAAWQLAERGRRVLALEQFQIAHDRGSSHGQTRIIRKAYFEHPAYVPLVHRAYELWTRLEQLRGVTLFERAGLLLLGSEEGRVIGSVRLAAAQHKLEIESLSAAEARQRFQHLRIDDDLVGLFEPDAGYLHVERCVETMAQAAQVAGARILPQTRVRDWVVRADGVRVATDAGEFWAERLVVTAGPWSAPLLADLPVTLEVRRKVQLWFAPRAAPPAVARRGPVFAYELSHGFFYGLPLQDDGLQKVAEHSGRELVANADALDRDLHADDTPRVSAFVERYLPELAPRVVRHSVCMYTMSPDEHFIVDQHPRSPRVFLAAGFSGHGFKFAPLVGELLADLVVSGRAAESAAFLRIGRFSHVNRRAV